MASTNFMIAPRFASYLLDWDYRTYLVIGGYGSGKSFNTALKIHLKLLQEKRTCLVVRNVFDTIRDSCLSVFRDIIGVMGMQDIKIVSSPMEIRYPNGSKILFRGLDRVEKLKSIHDVSVVWIEECSEIRFDAYLELLGRVRSPGLSVHFLLSCNPVGMESWVYRTFFIDTDKKGKKIVRQEPEEFYKKRTIVRYDEQGNGIYYHHSVVDDNPFIGSEYTGTLEGIKALDRKLWLVARWGRFGASGDRVLPRFTVANNPDTFKRAVAFTPSRFHFFGFDFGFAESYNAVVSCCVDDEQKILYIYDEIYMNKITDDIFCKSDEMQKLKRRTERLKREIVGDSAEPKTIQYYVQQGFRMRSAFKFAGSRLEYTKKMQRFKKIICSPKCVNCIRELSTLTNARDKQGNIIEDEFNIDSHTFSALWYALDTYIVSDYKLKTNSRKG